jgi:hypothetical protein
VAIASFWNTPSPVLRLRRCWPSVPLTSFRLTAVVPMRGASAAAGRVPTNVNSSMKRANARISFSK